MHAIRKVFQAASRSNTTCRLARGFQVYVGQQTQSLREMQGNFVWEPDVELLDEHISRNWTQNEPSLNELIREDLPEARELFRNVLQQYYRNDMGMWNKWAVMEWKAGNFDLARMIFKRGAKISFSPELWQSWASMEVQVGNHAEARRLYKTILATNPDDPMAGLGMALLESESGQQEKAREMLEELYEQHPEDVNILQVFGVFEARRQDLPRARELFLEATRLPDATPKVWHAWAKAEYDHGNYEDAIEVVELASTPFPMNKWIALIGAMAHFKLGNVYAARRGFRRLTDGANYVEPAAYNAFAQMELEMGNEDTALSLYAELLDRVPDHLPTIMSLAILYQKKGRLQPARRLFETAQRQLAKANAHAAMAELLVAWGDFEEQFGALENARELLEEASKQQPTNTSAWRALARVESKLGNVQGARSALTRASQQLPSEAPLLVELAKIEQKHKNYKQARIALQKALKLDPSQASVWNMRALIELPWHPDRARNIVETALGVIPSHEHKSWSILMCTYGRAFAQLGDLKQAVAAFQRSFKLQPKNWETHVIYSDTVLAPNDEWGEARKHLEAARRLLPRTDKRRERVEKKLREAEAKDEALVSSANIQDE